MHDSETATRRNMKRSRIVVFLAFFTNAALNFLLLGVFARLDGLNLVGTWAFLNSILLTALIADFGVTNALTFRIGQQGVDANLDVLRRLLQMAALTGAAVLAAGVAALPAFGSVTLAMALTVLAGLLQLGSNWIIAIRMGQHEQYWFNIKTVLRVVLQTAFALGFVLQHPQQPMVAFSVAFVLASLAEILFAAWLTRSDWSLRGERAPISEAVALARGFGLLNLSQRGFLPLSQLIISALAGPATLGVFAVASRVPIVITQSVSEALRALLPGLAGMRSTDDRQAALRLLRDGIIGQIILIAPVIVALWIHAGLLFEVWLGQSSPDLVFALRVISLGVFIGCLSIPHFWGVQALGSILPLSRATFVRVLASLAIGALALWLTDSVQSLPLVFGISQALGAVIVFIIAHVRLALLWPCTAGLRWGRIATYILGSVALNIALARVASGFSPAAGLCLVGGFNTLAFAPLISWITSKGLLSRPVGEAA